METPTPDEARFYDAHGKTRRVVECAFGILKNRFLCLSEGGLRVKSPVYACEIIKACTVLHNLALKSDPIDVEEELERMDERAVAGARLNAQGLESEVTTEDDDEPTVPAAVSRVTELIQLFACRDY